MKFAHVLAGTTLGLALGAAALADSVTLTPTKDNTLYQDAGGTLSNGAGVNIFTGKNGGGLARRAVLAFDVASAVPAGSTITSATLTLNLTQASGASSATDLLKLSADWGEGTSNATAGGGGSGTASTTNDATWIHRFFNTTTWATAGGDFAGTASATQSVTTTLGPFTWGPTAGMTADVQGWLDTPASNFGWLVRGDESASSTAKRFDSRESATAGNRPKLTIYYTPPVSAVRDWTSMDPSAPRPWSR